MRSLVLALVMLAACQPHSVVEVEAHPLRFAIHAPPVYRTWWEQMKRCSRGAKRSWPAARFDEVRFSVVEDVAGQGFQIEGFAMPLAGYYDIDSRRLYLIDEGKGDRALVGHEMLHALGFAHDPALFVNRCGVRS